MKKAICVLASIFALVSGLSQAQTPDGKNLLPPGPLIVPSMPAMSQWIIDFTYKNPSTGDNVAAKLASLKQSAAQDPVLARMLSNPQAVLAMTMPRPTRIVVTKTDQIRHEVSTLERGFKSETWAFGGYRVMQLPGFSQLNASTEDLKAQDFPEFGWITKENFIGIKKVGPTDCLAFQQDVPPDAILSPERFAAENKGVAPKSAVQVVPAIAYIDLQTRCPVAMIFNGEPRRYTIAAAPSEVLVVPEDFAAAARAARAQVAAATRMPAAP